ncbi:MAG: hypothetical protein WCP21_23540, partial [Armatimonadota bacterium]
FNTRERWDALLKMDLESPPGDTLGRQRVERDPSYSGGLFEASTQELFQGFFEHSGIVVPSPDPGREGAQS